MGSEHDSKDNQKDDSKSSSRKKIIIAIIIIVIVAILACIGTCSHLRSRKADTDKPPDTNVRTPVDVSDLSIVFINGEATLYWVDSSDAFLDHIEISWDPGGNSVKVARGMEKYAIPGLEEGVEYRFTVRAVDDWGNKSTGRTAGTGKAYKLRRPANAPPSEIVGIKGRPAAGQATLSWTNPDDSEYEYIELYYDTDRDRGDPGRATPVRIPRGVASKTLANLANGVEHTFYAAAVDAQGNRKPLKDVGLFIPDHATSPESVVGRPTSGELTLIWKDPSSSNSDVDHLEVAYSPGGETLVAVDKGTQMLSVPGLSNDADYEFTVYAVDSAGHRRPVTGAHVLSSGGSLTNDDLSALVWGKPVDGRLRLDWDDPALRGLSSIEIVTNPIDKPGSTTVGRGEETHTFTGLSDNEDYSFLVYGIDGEGNRQVVKGVRLSTPVAVTPSAEDSAGGAASGAAASSGAVVSGGTVSSDGKVSGRPVTGRVTLDWAGSGLTGHDHIEIITTDPNGRETSTTVRGAGMHTLTGLSDDKEYTFQVRAVAQGGKQQTAENVVLSTPPPPVIVARPTLRAVTLGWDDPKDPNLDHIEITYDPGDGEVTIAKGREINTFIGLEASEYRFQVTAVTGNGNRYAMNAEVLVPDLPIVRGKPVNGEISVEWKDPPGIKIDHLEVVYAAPGGREQTRLASTGLEKREFSGLQDNQEYSFVVFAIDDKGNTIPVNSAKVIVAAAPPTRKEESDLTGELAPLIWERTNETTFGESTVYTLSFGYTADRTPRWAAGGGEGKIAYSNDFGLNWIQVDNSTFGSFSINAICYANNRWIAGGKGGRMAWSTNAITWNAISQPFFINNDQNVNVIIYNNGRWVAGGSNGTVIISEDNGLTWRLASTDAFAKMEINTIAANGNRLVAGATGGKIVYSDDNGSSWTATTNTTFGEFSITAILYDRERWLAGGYAQRMAWSSDGITWRSLSRPFFILCMGFNGFRTVAGGQEGRMAWTGNKSVDWFNDTLGRSHFRENWVQGIGFGRAPDGTGRWLAGGQNGRIIFADEKYER